MCQLLYRFCRPGRPGGLALARMCHICARKRNIRMQVRDARDLTRSRQRQRTECLFLARCANETEIRNIPQCHTEIFCVYILRCYVDVARWISGLGEQKNAPLCEREHDCLDYDVEQFQTRADVSRPAFSSSSRSMNLLWCLLFYFHSQSVSKIFILPHFLFAVQFVLFM